ncbi:MAG: hypothetical protein D6820_03445 [Lentisphaerae bacterium]|nr:MAG: hypothetical protein D6820_03445 [Lentisphaerota bacterium]
MKEADSEDYVVRIVSVASGRAYQVKPDLNTGDKLYIDRDYTFTSVPLQLSGGYLIQTANDDKNSTANDHLVLDVGLEANIYVLYDRRGAADLPEWLNAWNRTDLSAGSTDTWASPYTVLIRHVTPGLLTLGGNKAGGGNKAQANYTVVVVPGSGGDGGSAGSYFRETNGLVVVEAEHFSALNRRNDPNRIDWQIDTQYSGFSGEGYLSTPLPQGTNGDWEDACEASWHIRISNSATYTLWIRRFAANAATNSGYVGIDGSQIGNYDNTADYSKWVWKKLGSVHLSSGEHQLQLRRREAGYAVDRILLTRDSSYSPSGKGPAESPRQ